MIYIKKIMKKPKIKLINILVIIYEYMSRYSHIIEGKKWKIKIQ